MEFSKELKLTVDGLTLQLISKEAITTLRTTKAAILHYRSSIEDCVARNNESKALQFFQLIMSDYPSSTMSTNMRPSWCASYYDNVPQYESTIVEWVRSLRKNEDKKKAEKYDKFFIKRHFEDYVTFEEWCSKQYWMRKFYKAEAERRKLDAEKRKSLKEQSLDRLIDDLGFTS